MVPGCGAGPRPHNAGGHFGPQEYMKGDDVSGDGPVPAVWQDVESDAVPHPRRVGVWVSVPPSDRHTAEMLDGAACNGGHGPREVHPLGAVASSLYCLTPRPPPTPAPRPISAPTGLPRPPYPLAPLSPLPFPRCSLRLSCPRRPPLVPHPRCSPEPERAPGSAARAPCPPERSDRSPAAVGDVPARRANRESDRRTPNSANAAPDHQHHASVPSVLHACLFSSSSLWPSTLPPLHLAWPARVSGPHSRSVHTTPGCLRPRGNGPSPLEVSERAGPADLIQTHPACSMIPQWPTFPPAAAYIVNHRAGVSKAMLRHRRAARSFGRSPPKAKRSIARIAGAPRHPRLGASSTRMR